METLLVGLFYVDAILLVGVVIVIAVGKRFRR